MQEPDWISEAQSLQPQMVAWRRDFHMHPELAYREHRTSGIVAETLQSLGFEVKTHVGKTGVVGLLNGARPGPTVLVRFDMDALPIREENDVPYRSQVPGVMHACGHDAHTAMGLGIATILSSHREEMAGRVKFIFQPAEEGGEGALAMIRDGVLEDPKPDVAFAMHVWNTLPAGNVIVQPGPIMASVSDLYMLIKGRGGHGALPHETVDPVVVAAHVIVTLQTFLQRRLDARETAVVSITSVHGGSAFNVIPDTVELKGTIRTLSREVWNQVKDELEEVLKGITSTFGATYELRVMLRAPATVNDPEATEWVRKAAESILGPEHVIRSKPAMVSEDMSEILERVPGCYFFLGSMDESRGIVAPHHSPIFDVDESVFQIGAAIMSKAVWDYLNR